MQSKFNKTRQENILKLRDTYGDTRGLHLYSVRNKYIYNHTFANKTIIIVIISFVFRN